MNRTELNISAELKLPASADTQKIAFLGNSGAGKTYGTGVFVERLLENGSQVVIIDTVGNWFGLRLAANGKGKGFSIPILGGDRGDVPLEPGHGKLVAETIAGTRSSMIVDISDFTLGETRRFVAEMASALLPLKKAHPGPVDMIWEECQDIVPQFVRGEDAKMVGAVQRLVKRGRNYGVGTVLISQRPAAVNKDVLNLIETLFAFRTTGKHDRKAIAEWVNNKASSAIDLLEDLPGIDTGSCFCWSPSWLKVFKLIHIAKKMTFDSTKTPDFDSELVARTLAPVDLAKFKERMSEAIEHAKESDPALMKARINDLERQLKAKEKSMGEVKKIEKPVVPKAMIIALERSIEKGLRVMESAKTHAERIEAMFARAATPTREAIDKMTGEFAKLVAAFRESQGAARAATPPSPPRALAARTAVDTKINREAASAMLKPSRRSSAAASDGSISGGLRRILVALAQCPDGLTNRQIGIRAGLSSKSGTFSSYIAKGRAAGWIDDAGGVRRISAAGISALGHFDPLPSGPALADYWLAELRQSGAARILRVLIEAYPEVLPAETIGERAEMSHKSGTYSGYIAKLKGLELIAGSRGAFAASQELA